jgi:triosephosphate isomerase (TIM)
LAQVKQDGRTPLIAGNWKMNLDHLQSIAFVQKLAWSLKDANHDFGAVEVAVFPPFTDLRSVQTLVNADDLPLAFGGQDISEHDDGAYTGEISGAFLAALDTKYVIIGHSERRQYHGETDEQIAAKVAAAHRHGIVPIVCVGETAEDLEKHGPSRSRCARHCVPCCRRCSVPRRPQRPASCTAVR